MFRDLQTTNKGDFGENLVLDWFEGKNIVPYGPINQESHPIDFIFYSKEKNEFFLADVKTKPKRIYYPDQGIDLKDYEKYKELSKKHNMPVVLFFVDETTGTCYGGKLDILEKHFGDYPIIDDAKREKVIYFPVSKMKKFFDLEIRQ